MTTQQFWEQAVLVEIDRTADELITLASELIKIPSENPPGDCTQIGKFISTLLRDAGVDLDMLDPGQGRLSLVAHRIPGQDDASGPRHLVSGWPQRRGPDR